MIGIAPIAAFPCLVRRSAVLKRSSLGLLLLCVAPWGLLAHAGTWTGTRTLQGPFATSSPPASPDVATNGSGHAGQ